MRWGSRGGNVLAGCLIVYVPVATLAMLVFWIVLVKGPLEFTTTFERGSLQPLRKQQTVFVVVGFALLAGIVLFLSFGINDL